MAGATVAVCLAVHRPDPEPLRRQLASLQAQTRRDLAYVDRPLVDYVQHGANLVGHAPRRPAPGTPRATEPWRARAPRPRAPRGGPARDGARAPRTGRSPDAARSGTG